MLLPITTSLAALTIPLALIIFTLSISARTTPNREKLSPFECGFDPKNKARLPFSLRFFLLAIIFLVFDIEIILLLPIPLTPASTHPLTTWPNSLSFLLILLVGLLHEWQEGSLEWHS